MHLPPSDLPTLYAHPSSPIHAFYPPRPVLQGFPLISVLAPALNLGPMFQVQVLQAALYGCYVVIKRQGAFEGRPVDCIPSAWRVAEPHQSPAPHPSARSLHTFLLQLPRARTVFPHSQVLAPRWHNQLDLEINLVQPSLLQNGEMELQRQKVPTPDHTAALAEPGVQPTLRGAMACLGRSLWGFRHLLAFRLNSKTRTGEKVLPSNQCALVLQGHCTGGSGHDGKRP